MLLRLDSMKNLNFSALMDVYEEGNRQNAAELFPNESEFRGIALAEEDFRQYLRECFFTTSQAIYWVWMESGKYVSALRTEPYQDGLLLEALETKPDQRRKGYAAQLITSVVAELPQGTQLYSHVNKKNIASLQTHLTCGFEKIRNYAVYADGSIMNNAFTLRIVCGN